RRAPRVGAHGQVVGEQLAHGALDDAAALTAGDRLVVGDDQPCLRAGVLEAHAVAQRPAAVAEVQCAGGAAAGEHAQAGGVGPARGPGPVAALLGGVVAGAGVVRCGHHTMLAAPAGAAAVEPRTMSWGRTTTSVRAGRRESSPPPRAVRTAARAMEPTAWRTVVSGGLVSAAQKTSSYPAT